jgi:hypothetical protein
MSELPPWKTPDPSPAATSLRYVFVVLFACYRKYFPLTIVSIQIMISYPIRFWCNPGMAGNLVISDAGFFY